MEPLWLPATERSRIHSWQMGKLWEVSLDCWNFLAWIFFQSVFISNFKFFYFNFSPEFWLKIGLKKAAFKTSLSQNEPFWRPNNPKWSSQRVLEALRVEYQPIWLYFFLALSKKNDLSLWSLVEAPKNTRSFFFLEISIFDIKTSSGFLFSSPQSKFYLNRMIFDRDMTDSSFGQIYGHLSLILRYT